MIEVFLNIKLVTFGFKTNGKIRGYYFKLSSWKTNPTGRQGSITLNSYLRLIIVKKLHFIVHSFQLKYLTLPKQEER